MENTAKRRSLRFGAFALALLMLVLALPVFATEYPKAENYIADNAGVLSENTVRSLRKSNENMKKDYGVVVAICTVSTTGDSTTKDYARAVFSEWRMGEGVLLLIVADSQDYYIVQSTGLQDIITNEQLQLVRNDYLEPDFATGNIDRGVQKSATKLTSIIERGLKKKAEDDKKKAEEDDGEGTAAGRAIVIGLQVFLCVALGAVGLFAIMFVVAIFNDDVALIMNKYVFNRKKKSRYQVPDDYYDERLYGTKPERPRERRAPQGYPQEHRERPRQSQSQRRNPPPRRGANPQNRMYDEYRNQRQNHADVYYNSDGTVRRAPGTQNAPRPRAEEYDATRTFSVPEQYNRRR